MRRAASVSAAVPIGSLLILLQVLGCYPGSPIDEECKSISREYLYNKSTEQTVAGLRELDLENQFKVYLCGMHTVHPPALELVEPIARQGAPAAELMKQKLTETDADYLVLDIARVYNLMDALETYPVAEDESAMQLLTKKVEAMRDPDLRARAREAIARLGTPSRARD